MPKERRTLRIESARQKIKCDAAAVCAQYFRVAQTRERMVIGDEIKRFALGLQRDCRPPPGSWPKMIVSPSYEKAAEWPGGLSTFGAPAAISGTTWL